MKKDMELRPASRIATKLLFRAELEMPKGSTYRQLGKQSTPYSFHARLDNGSRLSNSVGTVAKYENGGASHPNWLPFLSRAIQPDQRDSTEGGINSSGINTKKKKLTWIGRRS